MTDSNMAIEIKVLDFNEIRNLLHDEHVMHVAEIQSATYSLTYNPDWDTYQLLHEAGNFLALAAFVDGRAVGYLNIVANKCLHSKEATVATADNFFVHPDFRRHGVMQKLVSEAEHLCQSVGIHSLTLNVMHKVGGGSEFVESLGYEPAEVSYTKVL